MLVKDQRWSARLGDVRGAAARAAARASPCRDAYKRERPGTDSDLNAYDVLYYAGDANAGAKTIAINLPNDETGAAREGDAPAPAQERDAREVRRDPPADRERADRRRPAAARHLRRVLRQRDVPRGRARPRHQEHDRRQGHGARGAQGAHGALEEGKADILGLYMVARAQGARRDGQGEHRGQLRHLPREHLPLGPLRRVERARRARTSSRFNFFEERGAFTRDCATGTYRVDFAEDARRDRCALARRSSCCRATATTRR